MCPSNHTFKYLPKGNVNLFNSKTCVQKYLNSFTYNRQKLETTHCPSTSKWINWKTFLQNKRKNTDVLNNMDESQMHYTRLKRPDWEGYILYDSTDFGKGNGYKNRKQISGWNEKLILKFSTRSLWEVMDLFCILILVKVTYLYALSKLKEVYSNFTIRFNYTICTF